MNARDKFKPCWWLWVCISVPPVAYCLFRLHVDKAGDIYSDLGFMLYAIGHPNQFGWRYCQEPLFWDVLVPLVFGWVAQCLLVVAWDSRRRRGRASGAAS
jgi:hypothetical protein